MFLILDDMGLNHFDWSQLGLLNYSGETDVLKPERNQQQQQQQVQQQQQRWPPLRCPRCDSTNTKFCYYNNYSKSQPRHLCKACRRHWTEGGTLRNVPVGGVRKNKRNTKKSTTTTPQTTTTAATNSNTTNNSNMATNCSTFAQRLVNGNPSSSALPEILRQAMLRASPPPPPLQFMPLDYGVVSSTSSTWDVAPPTQVAPVSNTGYWNWSGNWEDEVSCLVAPELMPPTTDDS